VLHDKLGHYHVTIEPNAGSPEWGVRVREDVTGGASIHIYGLNLEQAIAELRSAAKALQLEQPRE
jgi:hypothetical protein